LPRGSCIFTIISELAAGPGDDRTRIAAQIVTGVGFLGAGSILRGESGVFGLTTAATIWAVAAVGMAVGFGQYILAAAGTGTILVTLLVLQVLERWVTSGHEVQTYRFSAELREGLVSDVAKLFENAKLHVLSNMWYEEGTQVVFEAVVNGAPPSHHSLREFLLASAEYHLRGP
jgi:putative Mg2+ transporter-C (MgtC) family protein